MTIALVLCGLVGIALLIAPYLDRSSPPVRVLVIGFMWVNMVRYGYWRATQTLPDFAWSPVAIFCYLLVLVEIVAVYVAHLDLLKYGRKSDRGPAVASSLDWYGTSAPMVDILIPTYNEPWHVIERTLVGATEQNYPNYRTWILDDGRRDWLREKAAEWNVGYITRSDNSHYKAGNINNALSVLRQNHGPLEFIAVLDADFVARPEFIRRGMALMKDESIAIVQTPQWFYNPDPFQQLYGGVTSWPDDQRQWFDETEAALDANESALCCGTSCVVRLRALDSIGGGFPTDSISEDSLCSMVLRRVGWKTRFLNEPLTVGLAPEGLGEFLSQRARWQLGWVEIRRYFGPGPGFVNHLHYYLELWKMLFWGFLQIFWVAAPLVYWYLGIWILRVPAEEAFLYLAPMWLDRVATSWLWSGRRMHFVSDAHFGIMAFTNIRVVIKSMFFPTKARFNVTDKGVKRNAVTIHWTTLRWYLLIGGGLVLGVVYNLIDPTAPVYGDGLFGLYVAFTVYSLLRIVSMALPTIEAPKRRTDDRYATKEAVTIASGGTTQTARCRNISVGGMLVDLDEAQNGAQDAPTNASIDLRGVGRLAARLVRRQSAKTVAYAFDDPGQRRSLIRKIYCSAEYVPLPARWSLSSALVSFLRRLVWD